jgi:hypothetical protein
VIEAEALHRAADRIDNEAHGPELDGIAAAIADFLNGFTLHLDTPAGRVYDLDPASLGYGVMIGLLAAQE